MRTIPDEAQKKAITKAFKESKYFADLLKDFKNSFKIMEIQTDKDPKKSYYIFWSSMLNRTFRVPVSEVIIPIEKENTPEGA